MILYFRKTHGSDNLIEVKEVKHGDWISVLEPTPAEIKFLIEKHGIPPEFIHSSLDMKERSRIDQMDDHKLFILRLPIKQNNRYHIMPLGIIINRYNIFTIALRHNEVINAFLTDNIAGFYTTKRTRFLLYLIKLTNNFFDKYVEELYQYTDTLESRLLKSERNIEVVSFLEIQKTITFFHAGLINNGVLFEKIIANKKVEIYPEDKELLEDMIIENKELLETVNIFMNNLGNTMDAYTSIISNNLNITMKFLTSLTIILSLPTILTSFYGMNIALPYQSQPLAYVMVILLSLVLIFTSLAFFIKKNWL